MNKNNLHGHMTPGISRGFFFSLLELPLSVLKRLYKKKATLVIRASRHTEPDPSVLARNFAVNMAFMNAICREKDVTFLSILQPLNGIGRRPLTKNDEIIISAMKRLQIRENYSVLDFNAEYYRSIRQELRDALYFRDYTGIFDETSGQIFFDTCHFSDTGQEIVAEALFRDVEKMVGK